MSAIDFKAPAAFGEVVEIGCKVVKFGRTSITVECVMRNKSTGQEIIKIDAITFVSIDENGRPVPHGKTESVN